MRSDAIEISPDRWALIQSLFHEAVDLPPARRLAYLEARSAGDPALCRAVLELIAADSNPPALLAASLEDLATVLDEVEDRTPVLSPGDWVGPYQVFDELGHGGMGVVWRAEDPRLQRFVALKLLPMSAGGDSHQLEAEARALSALDHPNIATVYGLEATTDGRLCLALAHYDGETLAARIARGPLPATEALRIATGLAHGLAAAHERGIVHRDVKPANVILTAEGEPKLIDFGIATVTRESPSIHDEATRGTIAYLSPERARGERAGPPADVWALGVVLWEMLAGRRPFDAETAPALLAQITSPEAAPALPARLPISRELRGAVRTALAKDPAARFSDGGALVLALGRSGAARARRRRLGAATFAGALVLGAFATGVLTSAPKVPQGLVVLPFENLSGDSVTSYLAEGVADGLTTDLGGFQVLRVIARTSAFRSRSAGKTLAQLADQLDVETVIEGSVRSEGGRFRLSLRLVEARTGRVLWDESLTAAPEDLPALRGRLARDLAAELGVTPPASLRRRFEQASAIDPGAYASYLRGRFHWNRRTGENLRRAQADFDEALDRDPAFAEAWAALANTLFLLPQYSELKPHAVMPQALRAARRAIALDSSAGEAYSVLGSILDTYTYDHAAATKALRRAVELAPANATALHFLAVHLCALGQFAEARALYQRALRLDPVSPVIAMAAGFPDLYGRDYPAALRQFSRALELDSTFALAHASMGRAYLGLGRPEDAIRELERARPREAVFGYLGYAYARAGWRREAQALAEQWREAGSLLYLAFIQIGLGDRAKALDLLESAVEQRSPSLQFAPVQPLLDELRSEPRFQALLARMGY